MTDDHNPAPPEPLPAEWIERVRADLPPSEPPREEMWAVIAAEIGLEERAPHRAPSRTRRHRIGWVPWALAAGLALLAGLTLGRWSGGDVAAPPASVRAADPGGWDDGGRDDAALRQVAARHLADTDALLAFVLADAKEGRADREIGGWGRELLTETRLLLDSSVADDPLVRPLLEDLEILLAEVALLGPGLDPARARGELTLIAGGVQEGAVRQRIRSGLLAIGGDPALAADD